MTSTPRPSCAQRVLQHRCRVAMLVAAHRCAAACRQRGCRGICGSQSARQAGAAGQRRRGCTFHRASALTILTLAAPCLQAEQQTTKALCQPQPARQQQELHTPPHDCGVRPNSKEAACLLLHHLMGKATNHPPPRYEQPWHCAPRRGAAREAGPACPLCTALAGSPTVALAATRTEALRSVQGKQRRCCGHTLQLGGALSSGHPWNSASARQAVPKGAWLPATVVFE